jgi:hypothetical protein
MIFILLGMTVLSFGQDRSVKSFYLAETDMTANTPGTIVYDQNGSVCALIKVESTLYGFSFDVGALGISEGLVHTDGEWFTTGNVLDINILPHSLKVLVP